MKHPGAEMTNESRLSNTEQSTSSARCLIIVSRAETELWQYMAQHYGEFKGVRVLLDRRQWRRRQVIELHGPERRRQDRRRPPSMENDLRDQPFVVVSQSAGWRGY